MHVFRTGLHGRGVLQDFGANLACDPVITRVDPSRTRRTQVLVCQKTDAPASDAWGLPGGKVMREGSQCPDQRHLPEFLTAVVMYNIRKLGNGGESSSIRSRSEPGPDSFRIASDRLPPELRKATSKEWEKHFSDLLNSADAPVYKGYCDDPRNTDQAWMETRVYHTHLPDSLSRLLDISDETSYWQPSSSDLPFRYRWIDVDCGVADYRQLYASHFDFVELCVPYCRCGRRQHDQNDGSHAQQGVPKPEAHVTLEIGQADSMPGHPQEQGQDLPRTKCLSAPYWRHPSKDTGKCGEIQFLGNGTPSYYVRARIETDDDIMHALHLLALNGLREHDALISVTGGAQDFSMDGQTIGTIFSGIVQAALTFKACIVDGGTDAGVMKLLGDAVARGGSPVDLVGVAGWGIVIGREEFERCDSGTAFYSKTHASWKGGAGLDPNHSHFLLVDNGTAGIFGTEITVRGRLEAVLRERQAHEDFKILVKNASCMLDRLRRSHELKNVQDSLKEWRVDDLIRLHKYAASISCGDTLAEAAAAVLRSISEASPAGGRRTGASAELTRREIHDITAYLSGDSPDAESATSGSSESILSVPCCSKCDGLYHDNYATIKLRNSLPKEDCDAWFRTQTSLRAHDEKNTVTCGSCEAKLSGEDVKAEKFHPCQQQRCDHYFFWSRCVDMRHRSRDNIICDGCQNRTKVEEILGKFIPAVLVVVEGGKGTIRTVASINAASTAEAPQGKDSMMLQSKNRCTPIVVVDGSGRAADFIASIWRHMHEGGRLCHGYPRSSCVASVQRYRGKGSTQLLEATCPFVDAEHRRIFGYEVSGDERKLYVSWAIETCRRREAVTIYNPFTSSMGIDFAIMRAICRGTLCEGKPLSMGQQFRLAVDWSLSDTQVRPTCIVRIHSPWLASAIRRLGAEAFEPDFSQGRAALQVQREILAENASKTSAGADALRVQALFYALKSNSWKSVQLLLDSGIKMPKRDGPLKGLYPRERSQVLNDETAVPIALYMLMTSSDVKRTTCERLLLEYELGNFPEEVIAELGRNELGRKSEASNPLSPRSFCLL